MLMLLQNMFMLIINRGESNGTIRKGKITGVNEWPGYK